MYYKLWVRFYSDLLIQWFILILYSQ